MNLIWESQSGLKERGKLCQCLTFLKDTGHHGIFQVRFWCLFFINSFHCKKVQIQRLNVADLITAAEFYSFLAFTMSAVNLNNVFSSCLWDNPFFLSAWFISNNSEGQWIWYFLEWSVCLEAGGSVKLFFVPLFWTPLPQKTRCPTDR